MKKNILIYVLGIITGVVMAFMVLWCYVAVNQNSESEDNIELFDKPHDVIPASSFEIMQVLPNGSALARKYEMEYYGSGKYKDSIEHRTSLLVLFIPMNGEQYYNDQKIQVPVGKITKQVGKFRYTNKNNERTTVPVVKFYDKWKK